MDDIKPEDGLDAIYLMSLGVIFLTSFYYPIVLLLILISYTSVAEVGKKALALNDQNKGETLAGHCRYFYKVSVLACITLIVSGLLLQCVYHPVTSGIHMLMSMWAFYRMFKGRLSLKRKDDAPISA